LMICQRGKEGEQRWWRSGMAAGAPLAVWDARPSTRDASLCSRVELSFCYVAEAFHVCRLCVHDGLTCSSCREKSTSAAHGSLGAAKSPLQFRKSPPLK
jgi:hypothetical protein